MRPDFSLIFWCTALLGACTHATPVETTPTPPVETAQQGEAAPVLAEDTAAAALSSGSESEPGIEEAAPRPGEAHHHPMPACTDVRVTFQSGAADLDDAARQQLRDYAGCVVGDRSHVLYVYGTTDPVGSDEANMELASARGRVVADYLQSLGCHMDLEIHARGEMDASTSHLVWPEERAATVSEAPHH